MTLTDKITAICRSTLFWAIIALPFVASFSSAAVDGCIGVLILAFVVKRLASRDRTFTLHPAFVCFFLLMALAALSFVNTVSAASSLQGIQKLLKYAFVLVIVFFEVRDAEHVRKIVLAAIAGLLLISLDAIYQLIFGVDLIRHHAYDTIIGLPRVNGTFPYTNIFAGYLALFIPMLAPLALYHAKGKARTAGIIIGILALFCLLFTFCRSAAIGVFLALLVMSIVRKDRVMFALLVCCLLGASFFIPQNIRDWSKTTNSVAELLLGKDRPIIFETAFNMIRHHPFAGVGVNTFSRNYQAYKLHDAVFDPGNQDKASLSWYAHNSYLQMAAETGIPYFLVFLGLIFMLFREGVLFFHRTRDEFLKVCSLGIMMGLAAFLVHGFTETNLYYPKIAVLFWFQAALLMAVVRVGRGAFPVEKN